MTTQPRNSLPLSLWSKSQDVLDHFLSSLFPKLWICIFNVTSRILLPRPQEGDQAISPYENIYVCIFFFLLFLSMFNFHGLCIHIPIQRRQLCLPWLESLPFLPYYNFKPLFSVYITSFDYLIKWLNRFISVNLHYYRWEGTQSY